MAEEVTFTGLVDPKAVKRIKVTCRCGHKAVYEVVEGPGVIPIIECERCSQKYAYGGASKPLVRLDANYKIEGQIQPETKELPTLEGTWTTSASKMVN